MTQTIFLQARVLSFSQCHCFDPNNTYLAEGPTEARALPNISKNAHNEHPNFEGIQKVLLGRVHHPV